jgi:hypothetical protein
VLSTTAVVFAFGAAHAAPLSNQSYASRMEVKSYAELLDPIPNAVEKLRIDDLFRAPAPARLIPAQYHHHHHHHHQYHHHHHHFDDGPGIVGGIVGGLLGAPPMHHLLIAT